MKNRHMHYTNVLLDKIRRLGLTEYVKNIESDEFASQIKMIKGNITLLIDIGVTDSKPYYYIEALENGETIYEKETHTYMTVTKRIKYYF